MSVEYIGLLVILVMFILMFLRIPIAIAMGVPSIVAIYFLRGEMALFGAIEAIVWDHSYNYTLTTIPMFILMGQILYFTGISSNLFEMFRKLFGRVRGALAIATIGASGVFAASSGSSVATTGTMGVIAAKEMIKSKYNNSLAGGSIAAGGTLGILIPPSTMFIIYGMLTEQSIGQLLIAGIIPGILLTLFFIFTVMIVVYFRKDLAPVGEKYSWKEKITSLRATGWVLILFLVVIGGMYTGLFTPTESAGVGAVGAAIIALIKRKLTLKNLLGALADTLRTTGFIFAIVIGAFFLNYLLAITRVPMLLEEFLANTSLPPVAIFACIILMYILLGAVMDALAMIVVTVPIVLPIIEALGFDLIWFAVIIVLVVEMGLITPPIGMNCFVLNGVVTEYKLEDIFKGALLFVIPIIFLIILLVIFPEIALFLPQTMS
ncbi:TRAP transporter large permease [Bacillus dakarensis]|uniref:TRAP transporter large permease n=1 Tax=Robertmurraya dakarensis TaxID=1926278 RepID=UPI0009826708|nr:TRAP transporter large permease [Bacillus dakarensis]